MFLHCDICGRFMSKIYDAYTPFGHSEMCEPPEDVVFCENCANNIYLVIDSFCKKGIKQIGLNWLFSNAEKRALLDNSYIIAGPQGCSWAMGFRKDSVPNDYKIWYEK